MKSKAPRRIVLAGVSALALAGCREEAADVTVFDGPEACRQSSFDAAECEGAYEQALAEHEETAPRYDAQAVCEAEHGQGACVVEERPGGGSVFLPLMSGFLLGQMLSGGMARGRPLVRTGAGGFSTTDGRIATSSLSGRSQIGAGAYNANPASTRNAAPMTRSSIARTGGFGAARTSRGTFGGLGG